MAVIVKITPRFRDKIIEPPPLKLAKVLFDPSFTNLLFFVYFIPILG